LGAGATALLRPPALLATAQAGPQRSDDVWGQLYQAKLLDTEQGWLAVFDNFPDADIYPLNLARQGLIYHYLTRTQDYDKVIKPAKELETAAQASFQAYGLAGLVVAYVHLGDNEHAQYAYHNLTSEMRKSLDEQSPRMAQLLDQALDELSSPL
jgi:hypothetical protein